MASIRPTRENENETWHNVRLSRGRVVRVMWFNHCWRTVDRPVTPKQAHAMGWTYVGRDTPPRDRTELLTTNPNSRPE